ncbi:MAG TPA: 4-alpha-glucanotransferase [Thermoanaerobaculia bacterium]|nr:4-alpha-glucanotransferase [Thermoanaerobaculia bacterium]
MHTSDLIERKVRRAAGVLLHPTSLPGRYGAGDLGDELTSFLDWAASAGMHYWQVLPINPPGYGNSPYGCLSSFAGSPLLISPQRLLQERLLTAEAMAESSVPPFPAERVDFDQAVPYKMALLRETWNRFGTDAPEDHRRGFGQFEHDPQHKFWLDDFATFMALKERTGGAPWWSWDTPIAHREKAVMRKVHRDLRDEIRFHKFVQYLFFSQWRAVRDAARKRGIAIIGDVPIYVALDSADVWASRELFQLDDGGQPVVVAGVPPDYFSSTGQRWGNPLYRWDVMAADQFRWWVARVRANLAFADIVRLDHFRGFVAYWEIPASEPTAIHGRWMPGPGRALFDALRTAIGDLPLIAEDLGFITPEVDELRRHAELPGMKILQFGFGQPDSPHLPHRFECETVAYTGTHDNDTALGWLSTAPEHERALARLYLGDHNGEFAWALIRAAYTSVAETAIVPAQDILGLASEGRMNTPGAEENNWSWRLELGALTPEHAARLRRLAEITGRI